MDVPTKSQQQARTDSSETGSSEEDTPPSLWSWSLKVATSMGLAGMICCVAPAVLFALGLMGGIYAISFANFFYAANGSAGIGAWILRGVAVGVGLGGTWLYHRRQNQCSIDPARKRKNLVLVALLIFTLGTGLYFTFEELTSWYFDAYVVPAQQEQYEEMSAAVDRANFRVPGKDVVGPLKVPGPEPPYVFAEGEPPAADRPTAPSSEAVANAK